MSYGLLGVVCVARDPQNKIIINYVLDRVYFTDAGVGAGSTSSVETCRLRAVSEAMGLFDIHGIRGNRVLTHPSCNGWVRVATEKGVIRI